jgi:hypothetical protein
MRYVIATAVALLLFFAGIWIGIESGYKSGLQKACAIQHGTMVLATKALSEMRNNDTNALVTLQSLDFSAALYVLEECSDSISTNLPSFKALIDYRRTYRWDSSAWTPAEHELESTISKKFGGTPPAGTN